MNSDNKTPDTVEILAKLLASTDWSDIFQLLGHQLKDEKLPQSFACGICNGLLTVYPDIQSYDWLHCKDCKFAGDVLLYAAKVWKIDLLTTIKKLGRHNLPIPTGADTEEVVDYYTSTRLAYRDRVSKLYKQITSTSYTDSPETQKLHDLFSLTTQVSPDRWQDQLGSYIGFTTRQKVDTTFRPSTNEQKKSAGADKIFTGWYWDKLLAIPFWDLPGRLSAFWFVGREGTDSDWVFKQVAVPLGGRDQDPGLGFYNAAYTYSDKLGDSAFVIQDPAMCLRMHSKWFKDHGTNLPLLLSYSGHKGYSKTVFNTLPKRDWIFWNDKPNRALFQQATQVNGRVSWLPFLQQNFTNPDLWLIKVQQDAKPWDVALSELSHDLDDQELESILLNVDVFNDFNWQSYNFDTVAKDRINHIANGQFGSSKFTIKSPTNRTIEFTERNNMWAVNGELIYDANVRLLTYEPCQYGKGSTVKYNGIVFTKRGHTCEFTYYEHEDLFDVVNKALIQNGYPSCRCLIMWRTELITISKYFYEPRAK